MQAPRARTYSPTKRFSAGAAPSLAALPKTHSTPPLQRSPDLAINQKCLLYDDAKNPTNVDTLPTATTSARITTQVDQGVAFVE